MSALSTAVQLRRTLSREVCLTPGTAAAVLDELRLVVPADCCSLSTWDRAQHRHRLLHSSYPRSLDAFLDDEMHYDPLFVRVQRSRIPTRVRDIAPAQRSGSIFDRIVRPAGFKDGLTHCLFARDGRYVGMLNASTSSSRAMRDEVVHLLDLLSSDLGAALDPLAAPPVSYLGLDQPDAEGFLVVEPGGIRALSCAPRPDLLRPPSPLLRAVRRATVGGHPARLLLVDGATVHEVEVTRTVAGVVVVHREIPAPNGLTTRELQVLIHLGRGHTNAEAGCALGIGARTVATHVERVLLKTGCRNRVEAAGWATERGLGSLSR